MNILHYSLGFPPFRRGGMTQYCIDLMVEQIKSGHDVGLLWPGVLRDLSEKSKINKRPKYAIQNGLYCDSYEIINPLPIPLMDGIRNPEMYLIKKGKEIYRRFFQSNKIDVLHIHTFMGLPAELVEAANEAGVKTIFTTHDYFPLCPRCNFFHAGKDCVNDHNCSDCVSCNQYGLSLRKMQLFQSKLYKLVKENAIVKILRAKHNRKMYDVAVQVTEEQVVDLAKQKVYQDLRKRNIDLLESLDVVHFNSSNTLRVYQNRGYSGENACIVSISNGAIQDHKKRRTVKGKLRLGYLGPITTHKGYNLFKGACDEIWNSGIRNFEAHIFVEIGNPPPYMVCHKPYKYQELPDVMNQFDVLVTPSEWEETFGFTVLEGLSYGIPVIVSNRVGAKDLILEEKNGFVVEGTVRGVKDCLKKIIDTPSIVQKMNSYIVDSFYVKTMTEHASEIELLYRKKSMIEEE